MRFAASPSQEALWAGLPHRARPPVVTAAIRLTGHLDTRALAAAWQAVAGRHEILRSRYLVHEGRLTQVVAAQAGPTVPISLAEVRPSQVPAAVAAEREQAFDPARGRLARLRLLRQGTGDHVGRTTRCRWSRSPRSCAGRGWWSSWARCSSAPARLPTGPGGVRLPGAAGCAPSRSRPLPPRRPGR
ncbi:condensation domain-containing protein [Streptomyces sp. NPDC097981]|uniref:condensation domain-containing protein n=1 Tax=Streptomyces sp. NPDC097981 TaxID=3155428 RepID=UPI0033219599